MYVEYLYNNSCECATVKESTDGTTFVTFPAGNVKRFYTWSGAINFLIVKGFSFI